MVEFLIAYLPVLVAFLMFWQLGELLVAQMVVERASSAAGRAAVVVVPDDPAFYQGEQQGTYDGQRKREIRLAAGMMLAASPHLSESFTVDVQNIPGGGDAVAELTVEVDAEFRCSRLKWVCGVDGVTVLKASSRATYQGASYQYEPADLSNAANGSTDSSEPGCSDTETSHSGDGTRGIGGASGKGGENGRGGASGGGAGREQSGGSGGSGGACSASECSTLGKQLDSEECSRNEDLEFAAAFSGLDFDSDIVAENSKIKQRKNKLKSCSCPGAEEPSGSEPTAGQCPPKTGKKKGCPVHGPDYQLGQLLDKCREEFKSHTQPEVYARVQGGTLPQASQFKVEVSTSTNSGISVQAGAFCVSRGDLTHAQYFAQMRANQAASNPAQGNPVSIYQWQMPGWFNECVTKLQVPQKRFCENPNNLDGLAPKIVDPNQPGDSYELNSPWYKAFERYAVPGSLNICTYSAQPGAGTH